MIKSIFRQYLTVAALLLLGWLFLRYGLPVLFPFLLGAGLALAAEPLVGLLHRRLRFPRWLSSGIGVTGVFILLLALLTILIALCVREAGQLAGVMPDMTQSIQIGISSLENWMLNAANAAPSGIRTVLNSGVTSFFSGSSAVMERVTEKVLGIATGMLGRVTEGAFSIATGALAAFMISARMPKIRSYLSSHIPARWREQYLPELKGLRTTLTGWLMAQLKLTLITMALLMAGFWILRIPYAPVWAIAVSLIDALPVLGTGAVLIPWSIISLLQGEQVQGIGLLGIYALVWLVRSVMEPKLLGKELGLDPLVTLIAMYAGYKLFGLPGLILSPMLAVVAVRLVKIFSAPTENNSA